MKIVVTGGAGFIGANLCATLCEQKLGHVVAVDDLSSGRRDNLSIAPEATLIEASILDRDALNDAFSGASTVIHLAARPSVPRSLADPVATHTVNATGTINVLEAARTAAVPHVIVASSSSVYGGNPALPKSEKLAVAPLSPYAASKLATEAYALAYGASFGIAVLAFRFFNVFGPLQAADHAYAAVVPCFIARALGGLPLIVHGDGTQTRDFTYVGSVVEVLGDAAARCVFAPDPVNLAFGTRLSLLEMIAELEEVMGRPLQVQHDAPRAGDVAHSQADSRRLRELFPSAEPVPFRKGLELTVEWNRMKASAGERASEAIGGEIGTEKMDTRKL